jgi:phosphoribosylformimino-5-aminoimidazole carboxamide ribotide isomerase
MNSLKLVPVIDLRHGYAVHARLGQRESYQPLSSRLCSTGDPAELLSNLLALFPFDTVYIADLDAILRNGDNLSVLRSLSSRFPEIVFWVDSGVSDSAGLSRWLEQGLGRAVLGSESLLDLALLDIASALEPVRSPILSLDFREAVFLGPPTLIERPDCWPENVIVMPLTRVGSQTGPDLQRFDELRQLGANSRFFAAGGVRDAQDLARLEIAGAAGVLLATALHEGRLTPEDLALYGPPTA